MGRHPVSVLGSTLILLFFVSRSLPSDFFPWCFPTVISWYILTSPNACCLSPSVISLIIFGKENKARNSDFCIILVFRTFCIHRLFSLNFVLEHLASTQISPWAKRNKYRFIAPRSLDFYLPWVRVMRMLMTCSVCTSSSLTFYMYFRYLHAVRVIIVTCIGWWCCLTPGPNVFHWMHCLGLWLRLFDQVESKERLIITCLLSGSLNRVHCS